MKTKQHGVTPWPMLAVALGLPFAMQFAALVLPWERVWGFDALRYLPAYFQVAMLLLPFLLYFALRGMEIDFLRTPIAWLLLLLALLPPLLWPMQTYFYGDGGLLIPQIHRYSVDGGYDAAMLLNIKSAPLAGALLLAAMKAGPAAGTMIGALMPVDALYPFKWISTISLLAVAGYMSLVARGVHRLTLLLALAGTAGVLLFSGYVEYYSPVFAAIAVFVIAGERALGGRSKPWPVAAAFVVAVASHYMALALLPSLLLVLALRSDGLRKRMNFLRHADLRGGLIAGAAMIAAWSVVYFVIGFHDSPSRTVMPLAAQLGASGTQAYTLLSTWHIADMMNLFVLLTPGALIALIWTWIVRVKEKKFGDNIDAFHAVNFLLFAGFAFFANTSLGIARDWDMLSPLGIVTLLAAISALRRRYDERAGLAVAMISVLLVLPWTQLHRDADATAARFERVLALDSGHMFGDYALSGYDALRKHRHREGDLQAEIGLTKRMIEILDYPQHYRELARMAQLVRVSQPDSTLALQRWMLDRLSLRVRTLEQAGATQDYSISIREIDSLTQAIGFLALGNGRYENVRAGIESISLRTRGGRPFPAVAGLGFYQQRAYELAAEQFTAALREDFSTPDVYLFLGNALALTQKYSESLSRFEEGIRRHPDDGMLRFTLGKYYVRAGIQHQRAAELLRWCVERGDPADAVAEANALLLQLQGMNH